MKADTFIKAMGNIDERFLNVEVPERKIHRQWTKWVAGVTAALLLIACPLPAMTALGSDGAYSVLYELAPSVAQTFKPVRKSCTDDGIEMTVISEKCDGSTAQVCLAMRDLTGETSYDYWDLYDSYMLNFPYDMNGHCRFSEYDADSNTAYFVVELETMNGRDMPKKKVTFSLRELLLGRKETKCDIEIDMSAIRNEPEAIHRNDITGGSAYDYLPDPDDYRFLLPEDEPVCRPADNACLDAIGYVDGALHILMRFEDVGHTDSHGWVRLVDREGDEVVSEKETISFSYWYDEEHTDMCCEYVMPVEYDRLADCTLFGEFYTALGYRSGDWQVTFPLK